MIKRIPEDLKGLDDLKAAQALAKRKLERHLAGKPAMIDCAGPTTTDEILQREGSWPPSSRRLDLERAAVRLEAQNEARRRAHESSVAGWEAERRWWAIQLPGNVILCPSKVRHLIFKRSLMYSVSVNDVDYIPPDIPIVVEELVYCPCVARPPHGIRECICSHGQRGGTYVS